MTKIIGHEELRERLLSRLQSGKLHSALLLCGAEGIGKRLIAVELAKRVLCFNKESVYPCDVCQSCMSFQAGHHPDFFNVECSEKSEWNIEAIRDLLYSLSLTPFQGKARAVVFNDSEQLSLACHNVLLKTLEEPRKNSWFILTSSNASKLPITIRSRCQTWGVQNLTPSEVKRILVEKDLIPKGIDPEMIDPSLLADGSLATFFEFSQHIEQWNSVHELLAQISGGSIEAMHESVTAWSKDKDMLKVLLHFMRIMARERMRKVSDLEELSRWAIFLTNVLNAERLIFDRNISSLLVLQHMLRDLLPSNMVNSWTRFTRSDSVIDNILP